MKSFSLRVVRAFLASSVVLFGLASPVLAAGPPHVITTKDKKTIECEIVKEGPKEISYKDAKGKPQTITNDSVSSINYKDDFPGDLASAENAIERRDYFKAVASADDAIKACADGRLKELFLARARVVKAKALRGLANFKEAADTAKEAIDAANGNKWAVWAHLERVCSLAALGSDDCVSAGSAAEEACNAYPNEVLADLKAEIGLAEGEYFISKGNTSSAKEKFGLADNSRKFADRAALGRGRVKILEKDFAGAEAIFEDINRSSQDADALAGAALGLGDAALEKAKRNNPISGDDLRTVLEKYLRGAVLAPPSAGSMGENHENTLRRAAEVCGLIVETITLPTDKKAKDYDKLQSGKKFFVDYARKLLEEIQRTYPSSQKKDEDTKKIGQLKAKSAELTPAQPTEGQKN